jgi:hypothetical protein
MDSLQVRKLVIIGVHAHAEKEARVASVHDLGTPFELDKIGLVLLIAGRNQAVDLSSGKFMLQRR